MGAQQDCLARLDTRKLSSPSEQLRSGEGGGFVEGEFAAVA